MDKLRELKAQRAKAIADNEALLYDAEGNSRDLNDGDRQAIDEREARIDQLGEEIENAEEDEGRFKRHALAKTRLQAATKATPESELGMQVRAEERIIPASARKMGHLRAFKGENAELQAYRFGVWFAASLGVPWAVDRARDQGIALVRTATEGVNTAGGFLVPDEFDQTIVDLREEYGVFRQHARIVPMTSDHKKYRRRAGGLEMHFVGESEAGTESTKTWNQLTLTARKGMVLTVMSSELEEDAIISVGDDLMAESAYAMVKKEDECGFMGDGSATYAGIVGVGPRLTNVNGVDEGGGVIVGTGNIPSELLLADFSKTVAILASFGDTDRAAWYCHRMVWAQMVRLEAAAGGNTGTDLVNGLRVMKFLGYPVFHAQCMDVGTAVSQVLAILGDLSMAADFGARRGVTMAISDSALNAFEQDELVLKVTERFDINVHDVGTATAGGPVVALVGKSS